MKRSCIMVGHQNSSNQVVCWRLIVTHKIFPILWMIFRLWERVLINCYHKTVYFDKEAIFSLNLWSIVQHNLFLREADITEYFGCVYSQISPSYVRCNTTSNTRIHKIIRKIKCVGDGGSDEGFLHKNHVQKL